MDISNRGTIARFVRPVGCGEPRANRDATAVSERPAAVIVTDTAAVIDPATVDVAGACSLIVGGADASTAGSG